MVEELLTTTQILELLEWENDRTATDIEECRALQHTLSRSSRKEALWVVQSSAMSNWLTQSGKSTGLLINGDRPDHSLDSTSFLSLVSAEISAFARDSKNVVSASYICGLHADEIGAEDMIYSLLGQLVEQFGGMKKGSPLHFVSAEQWDEACNGEVDTACDVLETLVNNLPKGMVFVCAIDGIAIYEARSRQCRLTLLSVLEKLGRIIKKGPNTTKLLLTTPGVSRYVGGDGVEVSEILFVPQTIESADDGIWIASAALSIN